VSVETEAERNLRERRRAVFDQAAERYDATRSGYPEQMLSVMLEAAGAAPGSRLLEIGCGTGQLTRQLVGHGVSITAIDPAASMIAVARRRLPDGAADFRTTTFEDFDAPEAAFDLVVSATAFHWVDPEIAWSKSARLLRAGGWLALLGTREDYDEPVGSALFELYVRNTSGSAAWARRPSAEDAALRERSTDLCERWSGRPCPCPGLYGRPLAERHSARRALAADLVVDLELTRATTLSYGTSQREAFVRELREILASTPQVGLTQVSDLVMAPCVAHTARAES
jgi:ubiquinone/menaquinone biosynthesis C-methylase UbiE